MANVTRAPDENGMVAVCKDPQPRCGWGICFTMKELKRVSNLWLKERGRDYADFEWRGGYADFSVS